MGSRTKLWGWIEFVMRSLSGPGAAFPTRAPRARGHRFSRGHGLKPMQLEIQRLESKLALAPVVTLGAGVADGATQAEATQASGVVTVSGEKNATIWVSFVGTTNGAGDAKKIVAKSVTGQGPNVAVPVTLTKADLVTITDGQVYAVSYQVVAGVQSGDTVVPFTLDTAKPAPPAVILADGVANGATQAEATKATGVLTVSGEKNAVIYVSFVGTTNGAGDEKKIVTKTATGKGPGIPVAVTLSDADLAKITNGTAYVVSSQVDVAGNLGDNTVVPFTLDTISPDGPMVRLADGLSNGATYAEATSLAGVLLVSGEPNAVIVVSFVGTTDGVKDPKKTVTKTVVGKGPNVEVPVILSALDLARITDGPVDVACYQIDAAGNPGPDVVASFALTGVVMDLVEVRDPGNAADKNGFGSVSIAYLFGKYEVTIGQYAKFLNAVARTDTYGLYNPKMGTDLNVAGISRSGAPGSYSYAVMNNGGNSANRPITYVSWFDAARFANWMHNGQPSGSQGPNTTERGAYSLNGATSGVAFARNGAAKFSIPSEDEWYKAAHYKGGNKKAGYWLSATQSDTLAGNKPGPGPRLANYVHQGVGFSVTQAPKYSATQNYLTSVGVFSGSASYYGTRDQTGNVWEWTDGVSGSQRVARGNSWDEAVLLPNARLANAPSFESPRVGFRLKNLDFKTIVK